MPREDSTIDPEYDPLNSRTKDAAGTAASASLAWGIVAIIAWVLPPVGVLAAMVGLIRGRQGWDAPNRDRARLGVVFSVA